ncbi:MAG: hypothetical protein IJA34_00055 [Lachnospiraceae bacterium]|nr:hypothetical protein [Lachnospiraceae bacterium]
MIQSSECTSSTIVYLDSSPFIRAHELLSKGNNKFPIITYNKFYQNPKKYAEFMNREFLNPSDKQYYTKLLNLLDANFFSHIITLNPYFSYSKKYEINIIQLFGSAYEMQCLSCYNKGPTTTDLICKECNSPCRPNHIFLDEEISLKNYGKASKILYSANTLLIDPDFFSFTCTKSLSDYIKSSSEKYILSTPRKDDIEVMGNAIKDSPVSFILSL